MLPPKSKRFVLGLCIVFLSLIVLPFSVVAHGGRTDGKGGHYDRSTGKYHYHHGYSAHDHYDMDGDGDLDCPYNFDDKTDQNSNTGGNSSNSASKGDTDNSVSKGDVDQRKKLTLGDVVILLLEIGLALLILLVGIFFILPMLYYSMESLLEFFFEKVLKRKIKESVVRIATIIAIVIIAITILTMLILIRCQ